MLARLSAWHQRLKNIVPDAVLRFGTALFSLAAVIALLEIAVHTVGRPPLLLGVLSLLLLVVLLGSAWLGYGPGLMVNALVFFVGPHLFPGTRRSSFRGELVRFTFAAALSLFISYMAQTRRRRERELQSTAELLQDRVREQTEEVQHAVERLRFVMDSAHIGDWDYDLAADTVARSRTFDEIFGYAEPVAGWNRDTFLQHVYSADRRAVEAAWKKVLRDGRGSFEFRIVRPDGKVRWVWQQAQVQKGPTGQPVRVGGVLMDITERRQSAENLREQAMLLDLAHDAILALDLDGTIRFWNHGAEEMYGWPREEALGKVSYELLQTVFPEPLSDIARRAASEGRWHGELLQKRRDGTQLRIASRWAVRPAAHGEPGGYLEINSDITERRQIEEQLRHTQKLESLGILAGGVAHDFNNLLTGILGNASLALDRIPPASPNRLLLEEVMKAAERAADLTRQLLAYAGKGRFVMRTLNLSELVREIAGLVKTSIPKLVQLRFQLADNLPGIDADPGQMQQIVMNLVINAAEAIGPEGGSVLVQTSMQPVDEQYISTMSSAADLLRPGDYVCLQVHDTGSGMSEETLARIFDPFFTTKFTGRGLGLSAVLGIVRAHRGALKVYSRLGRGTTFKVLLPASQRPMSDSRAVVPADLAGTGTVLVVDDEEVVRQTARHTLERYGYRTLTANDGASAVELYRHRSGRISLVLLDLTMPVMSGEDALRQLQVINPKVRVLLTSGYNEVEAVQRFAGKGLAGFIQKPFTAVALAQKVKEVLSNH